jgi:hypothetical protein
MSFRILLAAALVLSCAPALAAVPKVAGPNDAGPKVAAPKLAVTKSHPAPPKPAVPPLQFYVVRGAPDACGRGCDSWIAVEGTIDANAAARFRKFLTHLRGRNLPFYFASPGGNLTQAVVMGTMLREKPVIARVGRTVVSECGFEAQNGEACIKLKQSGRELHGDISTRGAFCGSACPYLILGATTREVAADAALVVHSAKIVVGFRGPGVPPPEVVAAANVRFRERSDQMLATYVAKMGVNTALLALVKTVKFEQMRVLTREEIVRFGIDAREFVETRWTFEPGASNMIHKVALDRKQGESSFRTIQWRLTCFNTNSFELDLQRPQTLRAAQSSISVSGGGPPTFLSLGQMKTLDIELWGARMTRASVQLLSDSTQTDFTETMAAADGRKAPAVQKLSNEGLTDALGKLTATCPAPPPQRGDTRDQAAK